MVTPGKWRETTTKSPINYYSWISNELKKNYNAFISITSATEKSQKKFAAAATTTANAAAAVAATSLSTPPSMPMMLLCFYSLSYSLSTYHWEVKRFSLECVQCTYRTYALNRTYLHNTNLNKLLRFFLFRVSCERMCWCECELVLALWIQMHVKRIRQMNTLLRLMFTRMFNGSWQFFVVFVSSSSLAIFSSWFCLLKITVRIVLWKRSKWKVSLVFIKMVKITLQTFNHW